MIKMLLGGAGFLLLGTAAWAQPDVNSLIDSSIKKEIQEVIKNPLVIGSIKNQNKRYAGLSQNKVEELDNLWRKQTKSEDQYLIAAVLSNPLSTYLTRVQAHSAGKFVEMFVMDDKGLNVGQSDVSSDYWQGDEDKWQKTYLKGARAVFVDEPEYDSGRKIWVAQYNIVVVDENNKPIGAAAFDINLTELARLKQGN